MPFLNSETKLKLLICRKSSRSYATCMAAKEMFRLTSCATSCIARMLAKLPVAITTLHRCVRISFDEGQLSSTNLERELASNPK